MIKRLTKRQILEETIAYYKEDPSRAARSEGGCFYITDDGRMCAVGRCMIVPKPYRSGVMKQWDTIEDLDKLLKEQYRGHSLEFWKSIQNLHDYPDWTIDTALEEYIGRVDCRMSWAEIVEETLQYYLEDPSRRGINPGTTNSCRYYTEEGKMCAVGRCMIDPKPLIDSTKSPRGLPDFENLLRPDYRGHSTALWEVLQDIHDSGPWNESEKQVRAYAEQDDSADL